MQSLRYMAREWDGAAGLYYVRNRWYAPALGRFISEDPIGLAGGINVYAYAGNDPINFTDPLGLCPQREARAGQCAIELAGVTVRGCVGGGGRAGGERYGQGHGGTGTRPLAWDLRVMSNLVVRPSIVPLADR